MAALTQVYQQLTTKTSIKELIIEGRYENDVLDTSSTVFSDLA